jgi:hypothetical protein
MSGIQPRNTDEAVMLLWDRLFGNGIEGAIPGMQRDIKDLRKELKCNSEETESVDFRLTKYIAEREETCPLVLNRKGKRDTRKVRAAKIFGYICLGIATNVGLLTLVLKIARLI